MAFLIFDRVQETSTSTGTGNFTLQGAKTGFRTFASVLATGDTTYYTIVQSDVGAWEVGIGTYSAVNTLTRTSVISSSNGGAAVNFGAGNKEVFITSAADMLPPESARSFNGRGNNITPVQADYDAFYTTTAEAAAAAPVQSVNGQTGNVTVPAGISTQVATMTAPQAVTSTALVPVSQLVLPVVANAIYKIECSVTFQFSAGAVGLNLGLTTPAGAANRVEIVVPVSNTAAASQLRTIFPSAAIAANAGNVAATGNGGGSATHSARISGQIIVGATAGNCQIVSAISLSGNTVTLQTGSNLILMRLA